MKQIKETFSEGESPTLSKFFVIIAAHFENADCLVTKRSIEDLIRAKEVCSKYDNLRSVLSGSRYLSSLSPKLLTKKMMKILKNSLSYFDITDLNSSFPRNQCIGTDFFHMNISSLS